MTNVLIDHPTGCRPPLAARWSCPLWLPFDAARSLHATAVVAGALPRSLRGWAAFERWLDCAERLALGPWARRR